ncbi:MAG: hypothetical protein H7Y43_07345 [Akkermansiaceae bacterium]|nr:hypothetical protein [Verrucomicrobiales bacterium]
MRPLPLILLSSIATIGVLNSAAQLPGAAQSQQLQSVEQRRAMEDRAASITVSNAPSLFDGEEADVGPQSVLRMVRKTPILEAFVDAQYFYTDNMFLADESKHKADVLVSTIQGALSAPGLAILGGDFVPRVGYRHQWFDYGLADRSTITVYDFNTGLFREARRNEFDFNAQTFFTDATWRHGNWVAGLAFDYRRLLDTDGYQQFYRELTPQWSLKRIVPLCSRSVLTLGYVGDYRATDTENPPPQFNSSFNDRTDHSLFADVTYSICKYAMVQASYRFQHAHFTDNESRRDHLNSFGLALYCPLNKNAGLRVFASYEIFATNGRLASDYNRFDAGLGLNLTLRF